MTNIAWPALATTWQLWGKADPKREGAHSWHPLLCHTLDVVACADRLLRGPRRAQWATAARMLDVASNDALSWLLLFVGLHDLGKATPPFQAQAPARADAVRALGFDIADDHWSPHGVLTCPLATAELVRLGIGRPFARQIARAVGGHHGIIPTSEQAKRWESGDGDGLTVGEGGKSPQWRRAARDIVDALVSVVFGDVVPAAPRRPEQDGDLHAFVTDLAGLTTAADWLGSNADVFEYCAPPADAASYWTVAVERAQRSLSDAGWREPPRPPPRTFEQLFGKTPWPLHIATAEVAASLGDGPSLVIIEAPMGEGKTEAALSVFDALAQRGATGLYFALPTQATSNQIFGRVARFLDAAYPGETHGLHLVHGDAGLSDAYDALRTRAFRLRSIDHGAPAAGGPVADAWFCKSKRALLAPIGVGTIDQALLGVLGVKHSFLRLHGLAGKVVVVDEVHAYDTYTSELLGRLLAWLRALGSHVVLLSATLPRAQRAKLVAEFHAEPAGDAPYPRITTVSGQTTSVRALPSRRDPVAVTLAWKEESSLPEELHRVVAAGGNVAVIVNTVARAQQLWSRLRDALPADVEVRLLHARFPFAARQTRERDAERLYGAASAERPHASVLVGTQVLEQSLDLDFDLMVTDLAPTDLVLQRAGRLHRHARETRPHAVSTPTLWLLLPQQESRAEGPSLDPSRFVYDEAVLLSSWLVLRGRDRITLPTDIEALVEATYTDAPDASPAVAARFAALAATMQTERTAERQMAQTVELGSPFEERDPWNYLSAALEDDDPRVHPRLRARTRLGDQSVDVVPVVLVGDRMALFADRSISLDPQSSVPLPRATVVAFARQSVSIGRRGVTHALIATNVPPAFDASGHLRFHRPLVVDERGETTVAGVSVQLSPDLGVVFGAAPDSVSPTQEPS